MRGLRLTEERGEGGEDGVQGEGQRYEEMSTLYRVPRSDTVSVISKSCSVSVILRCLGSRMGARGARGLCLRIGSISVCEGFCAWGVSSLGINQWGHQMTAECSARSPRPSETRLSNVRGKRGRAGAGEGYQEE